MLTVLESLKLSADFLERKGIESPRLNAELLLSEIMNCKRLDLYMKFDRPLEEEVVNKYREWISRRGKFEPLQYIVGRVEFYGLDFKVTPAVLIPRPETEFLVDTIVNRYKGNEGISILDIGAGSGNISIALAKNIPGCTVVAIDTSEEAIKIALENSAANNAAMNLKLINADINTLVTEYPFDLIVSNPPYVSADEYSALQKEIVHYEPSQAVTDMRDGLEFYRIISRKLPDILKKGGGVFLEVGKGQAETVKGLLSESNIGNIEIINDYEGVQRIVYGVMG